MTGVTQEKRHMQIESGLQHYYGHNEYRSQYDEYNTPVWTYNTTLFRYGITSRFELQFGFELLGFKEDYRRRGRVKNEEFGLGKTDLGLKTAILKMDKLWVSIYTGLKLPSGHTYFSNGSIGGELSIAIQYQPIQYFGLNIYAGVEAFGSRACCSSDEFQHYSIAFFSVPRDWLRYSIELSVRDGESGVFDIFLVQSLAIQAADFFQVNGYYGFEMSANPDRAFVYGAGVAFSFDTKIEEQTLE